jgi:hypothetical protein
MFKTWRQVLLIRIRNSDLQSGSWRPIQLITDLVESGSGSYLDIFVRALKTICCQVGTVVLSLNILKNKPFPEIFLFFSFLINSKKPDTRGQFITYPLDPDP